MSEEQVNEEFELLKMEAEELGVKFRSDIGQDKLQARVDEVYAEQKEPEVEPVVEPEPEEKPEKVEKSKSENWVDRVAMAMLIKGHGQRNVLLRACAEAGIDRTEGFARFTKAEGTMREKLIAIFG